MSSEFGEVESGKHASHKHLDDDYESEHEADVFRCTTKLFFFNMIIIPLAVYFITDAFFKHNDQPVYNLDVPYSYLAIQDYSCGSVVYSNSYKGLYDDTYGNIGPATCSSICKQSLTCIAYGYNRRFELGASSFTCTFYDGCKNIVSAVNGGVLVLREDKIDDGTITFA